MWRGAGVGSGGGWADRIQKSVAKNVRDPTSLISKIGDVVAPPTTSDEEESYYDSDDEYEDDDEYDEYEEYNEECEDEERRDNEDDTNDGGMMSKARRGYFEEEEECQFDTVKSDSIEEQRPEGNGVSEQTEKQLFGDEDAVVRGSSGDAKTTSVMPDPVKDIDVDAYLSQHSSGVASDDAVVADDIVNEENESAAGAVNVGNVTKKEEEGREKEAAVLELNGGCNVPRDDGGIASRTDIPKMTLLSSSDYVFDKVRGAAFAGAGDNLQEMHEVAKRTPGREHDEEHLLSEHVRNERYDEEDKDGEEQAESDDAGACSVPVEPSSLLVDRHGDVDHAGNDNENDGEGTREDIPRHTADTAGTTHFKTSALSTDQLDTNGPTETNAAPISKRDTNEKMSLLTPDVQLTDGSGGQNEKIVIDRDEKIEDEVYQLKETISSLQTQLQIGVKDAKKQKEHFERAKNDAECKIRQLASTCKDLQRQSQELHGTVEEQKSEFARKEKRLLHANEEAEKRIEAIMIKCKSLQEERDECNRHNEEESQKERMQSMRLLDECRSRLDRSNVKLEEQANEIDSLNSILRDMRSSARNATNRAKKAEELVEDLTEERRSVEERLEHAKEENEELKNELERLSHESGKLGGLQMELHLLKEERERDRDKTASATKQASTHQAKLSSERDAAIQQSRDLQQQLDGARADLQLVKSDLQRALTANDNLQRALESFQFEREAETKLWEERKRENEEAMVKAHAAAVDAMAEANEARMKEVQMASDMAVRNVMEEVQSIDKALEQSRHENEGLRRSLDEAIYRLQTSQEDVIDRSLMKNILLDWLQRRNPKERHDVLAVMSRVLHFTEEEKDKIGIGIDAERGTLGKVVGAVAAPLPPAALNLDKIEGENVREKWVNFLLAETGDLGGDDHDDGQVKDSVSHAKLNAERTNDVANSKATTGDIIPPSPPSH